MTEDLQNASVDTVDETETGEAQGTVVNDKVDTAKAETEPKVEMVSKSEFEKIQMRKNQLENELEEARQLVQNSGNDELVDKLQSQLDAYKQREEEDARNEKVKAYEGTLNEVFDTLLSKYPDSVKKAAVVSKNRNGILNLAGEHEYAFEAEKNIKSFLDDLQKELVIEPTPEIKVDAQNIPVQDIPETLEIAEGMQNMSESEYKFLSSFRPKE